MTEAYLIRHGSKEKKNGILLSELGQEQAKKVAKYLTQVPIIGIYSSPY